MHVRVEPTEGVSNEAPHMSAMTDGLFQSVNKQAYETGLSAPGKQRPALQEGQLDVRLYQSVQSARSVFG